MTILNLNASILLGKEVSFNCNVSGHTFLHRGVVNSVCLNLDGDHEILLDNDFFKLSEIYDFKIFGNDWLLV